MNELTLTNKKHGMAVLLLTLLLYVAAVVLLIFAAAEELFPLMVVCIIYLCLGWLILPAIGRVVTVMPPAGVALLAGGGAAYTVGILFYKSKGRYMHFVWHLFVLAGSVLQYFCVLLYCL